MKKSEAGKFSEIMIVLTDVYGNSEKPVSDLKIEFYFKTLSDLSIEDITMGVTKLMNAKTIHVFPLPAEIREQIQGKIEDRAVEAFDVLLGALHNYGANHSIEFEDGIIGKCVEGLGGWAKVCEWTVENRKWNRIEFEKVYRAYAARGEKIAPVRFAGELEINGGAREAITIGGREEQKRLTSGEGR